MGIPGGEESHTWISDLEALQKLARRQQGSCGRVKGIKTQLLNKMCVEINLVVMRNLEGRQEILEASYRGKTPTDKVEFQSEEGQTICTFEFSSKFYKLWSKTIF